MICQACDSASTLCSDVVYHVTLKSQFRGMGSAAICKQLEFIC